MAIQLSRFRCMNGEDLYNAFLAGTSRVSEKEQLLNRINVFPVPDGDTGTNMVHTLKFILENTTPVRSIKDMASSIAHSALEGARGNSGIIFAQFLHGFAEKIRNEETVEVKKFIPMVREGVDFAFRAIEKPVEGTIISVIRKWYENLNSLKEKVDDYLRLFRSSMKSAQNALDKTPQELEVLKKNNVVDAGAQGFVFFLEGILEFLKKGMIKKSATIQENKPEHVLQKIEPPLGDNDHLQPGFRYCVETLIDGENLVKDKLREKLKSLGDSLVIAGGQDRLRVHLHTDQPAEFFYYLQGHGTLHAPKVDDMIRQQVVRSHRKWPIALVTDSVCDLPQQLLDTYQVQVVPLRIHFGATTFFDKVTLQPSRFYELLESRSEYPTTSHPGFKDFENLFTLLSTYYDSIIALHMSKQLSGTWNAARGAAEQVMEKMGRKISVIDSAQLSGSLGLMVLRAAEAIAAGLQHDEIVTKIDQWKEKAQILVSVKDLKYMIRGGRVSPMKGKVANILNLKPIISLDAKGKSVLFDKAFSQKGNMKKVLQHIGKRLKKNNIWKYSLLHAHDEDESQWYLSQLTTLLQRPPDFVIDISPVVGLSAGHGAAAVALMYE